MKNHAQPVLIGRDPCARAAGRLHQLAAKLFEHRRWWIVLILDNPSCMLIGDLLSVAQLPRPTLRTRTVHFSGSTPRGTSVASPPPTSIFRSTC
jgi:hypothetical protein